MAETYKQKYQARLAEKLFRDGRIGDTQLRALLDQGAIALEGYQRIWEHYASDGYDTGALTKQDVANLVVAGKITAEAYERITGEPYAPDDGEGA